MKRMHTSGGNPSAMISSTYLNVWAAKILSKPIAASACEFNWSDVSNVVTKKTQRLKDTTIDKIVNTRVMTLRLEASLKNKVMLGNIPKVDDFLDTLVNETMDSTGNSGDDVEEAEELDVSSESGDEDLDVIHQDEEEELYEFSGEPNESLPADLDCRM